MEHIDESVTNHDCVKHLENLKVRKMWDAQRVQIEKRSKELISESFKLANQGDSANLGDAASQMEGIEAANQLPVATTGTVRTWKSWELERCFCNLSEELPSATPDQTPQE